MGMENSVITEVNTLGIGYEKYPVQNTVLCCNDNNGVKWIDLYTIIEDLKTKENSD